MKTKFAFKNFKDVLSLKTDKEKHKAWLEDYNGLYFSIGKNGEDKILWSKEKHKYIYSDSRFDEPILCLDGKYRANPNKIQRHPSRLVIEYDGDKEKAKEFLNKTAQKLKENNWGYIRSSHGGKSDYLWTEFSREITDEEAKRFLKWIAEPQSEIDLNFANSKYRFPVLFAEHWKYPNQREKLVEFYEGGQIDYDSLNIKQILGEEIINKDYKTFKRNPADVFTIENQTERFNQIQPLFYDRNCLWWLWNNEKFKWEIVDEVDILNMINEATGKDVISSKSRTEILNALKQKGRLNIPQNIKNTWIQFKDTIVDVETGEEWKATPKYFVTNPIPWELYNPRYIETPQMDKIFEEWVGKDNVKLLYEILAYCLLPNYPIHRLFCFIGSGMNGKSCFLRLLEKFVGADNVTSTELDSLIKSRFEVAKLHKKLVCMMGETDFSEISRTSILKKLTGQDSIGFEYKNKNPFDDINYAKIIIATNNLPTTTDKTIGFYRRWTIIDFPNQFSEEKDILSDIPDEEYRILAVKSLLVLKDILTIRKFTNEGTIEDRVQRYEAKADFLQRFLDEFVEESLNSYITKSEFQRKFNEWCDENRHRKMSDKSISQRLTEKGIEQGKKYLNWLYDGKGGDARVWLDIKWKKE